MPNQRKATDAPAADRFLRLPDVLSRVPVARSSLYRLIAAGKFPGPTKLGPKTSAWRESQVIAWMNEQGAQA
ncbi:helix-turn-helix transcriptional regulator [Paucibacter sp. DJ1R-11]|uniref:helix-turn-helix transcriptional regulator n=1 Tax=Paucibacter sp. DJ1R-11 TaxID=2893556 RepID=UPI00398C4C0F